MEARSDFSMILFTSHVVGSDPRGGESITSLFCVKSLDKWEHNNLSVGFMNEVVEE